MLRAAVLDVGGTLWPDRLTGHIPDAAYLSRLAELLPTLEPTDCLAALRRALREDDQSLVQDTHAVLSRAIRAPGAECAEEDLVEIRRALCVPASPWVRLFPGAYELLHTIHVLGCAASC